MTLSCNITSGGPVTDWKWEKDMVTRLITIICVCFVCLLMLFLLFLFCLLVVVVVLDVNNIEVILNVHIRLLMKEVEFRWVEW